MNDQELQKIAEIPVPSIKTVKMVTYSDYMELELYCKNQEEKLRIAREALSRIKIKSNDMQEFEEICNEALERMEVK